MDDFEGLGDELDEFGGSDDENENSQIETGSDEMVETDTEEEGEDRVFNFEDTEAKSMYVLPDTLKDFEELQSDVSSICSKEKVDVSHSEIQDACLSIISGMTYEVAVEILENRDVDYDEDSVRKLSKIL